ncbi:MAG: TetR/AcrR family transcriptional regulator [Bacteroidia bacterium]
MTKEKDIISQVQPLFFRCGIKSISMDEIANQLGVSKKTLYEHFQNKAQLVEKVVLYFFEKHKERLIEAGKIPGNSIDQLNHIFQLNCHQFRQVHPSVLYDIKKYYNDSWTAFQAYRDEFVYAHIMANLEEGIKQGLYRSELNREIITKLYIARMDIIMDTQIFPPEKFSFSLILHELFVYHIRGIATTKGLQYLENEIKLEF